MNHRKPPFPRAALALLAATLVLALLLSARLGVSSGSKQRTETAAASAQEDRT